MAKALAIIGLVTALGGVLILFRYGMPYHVESKGVVLLALEQTDHNEIKLEKRYRALGYVGLALVVTGTALQVAGVIHA